MLNFASGSADSMLFGWISDLLAAHQSRSPVYRSCQFGAPVEPKRSIQGSLSVVVEEFGSVLMRPGWRCGHRNSELSLTTGRTDTNKLEH